MYCLSTAIHAEVAWLMLGSSGVHMMGEKDISEKFRQVV
jgi:hypothetical protein